MKNVSINVWVQTGRWRRINWDPISRDGSDRVQQENQHRDALTVIKQAEGLIPASSCSTLCKALQPNLKNLFLCVWMWVNAGNVLIQTGSSYQEQIHREKHTNRENRKWFQKRSLVLVLFGFSAVRTDRSIRSRFITSGYRVSLTEQWWTSEPGSESEPVKE